MIYKPKLMKKLIGERLREAREQKGLTQFQVATFMGLQPAAVSHYECGRRPLTVERLYSFAMALGVEDVSELLPTHKGRK